ncbi:hypothetical protein ACS0TY_002802 [Phlomoides rotata]
MANNKNDEQKKQRVVTRARSFYINTLCGCRDGGVINSTVPQSTRMYDVGSVKEIDDEDLQGLMRILSMSKGGGATVDVDSEGNLVWRKPAAETSYGEGVGRIGRIDEDKPCCFSEVDVNKFRYFAINSKRINLA